MTIFLCIGFFVAFAYGVVSMVLGTFTGAPLPAAAFVCLFGGVLLGRLPDVAEKLKRLRTLSLLAGTAAALAGFVFLPSQAAHARSYALLLALAVLLVWKLRYEPRYYRFVSAFRFVCAAALVLIGTVFVLATADGLSSRRENAIAALSDVLPILVVMLACGVLALRGLRAADSVVDRARFDRRQLRDTLVFFAFCALCLLVQPWRWLVSLADLIYRGIVDPVSQGADSFGDWLFRLLRNPNPSQAQPSGGNSGGSGSAAPSAAAPSGGELLSPEETFESGSIPMAYIFAAFLTAALLIALVVLFFKLRKLPRRPRHGYPNEALESVEEAEAPEEKPISRFRREPRMKIRFYYRSFLHRLSAKHVDLPRSDTCERISQRAAAYCADGEALEEFTELYRKARYCTQETPTAEDAARAKALSRRL